MVTFKQARCMFFFFFNDTATTEIYTLSLHDALPIWRAARQSLQDPSGCAPAAGPWCAGPAPAGDRKSTRLNSSHQIISYAVFCLKKKILPDHCLVLDSTRR